MKVMNDVSETTGLDPSMHEYLDVMRDATLRECEILDIQKAFHYSVRAMASEIWRLRKTTVAASAYLKAEVAEAQAQNKLNRETERSDHSEALAELAWTAGRERSEARDSLMAALRETI